MKNNKFLFWATGHPRLVVVSIFLILDIVVAAIFLRHGRHVLTVAFLNIGQGDAVYIEAPNGNQLLYDAGPPTGAILRELHKVMPFGDRSIDVAVFSHPDMDHIGGFLDVLSHYKVGVLLEPGSRSDNGVWSEAQRVIAANHIPHILARRGMTIDLGGGVLADILYPDRDMTTMETNASSIVLWIHYGDTAFLLSGDLPQAQEDYVVSLDGATLHAQVLKLGHHGSRTSSSEAWLQATHPDVAIISAGENNRYGHPHKEVLSLLEQLHIPSLITWREGTIRFESDGTQVSRY